MNNRIRTAPIWSVLGLVVLAGCGGGDTNEGGPTDVEEISADQIVYGARQKMTKEGVREAILEADSMFVWADSTHMHVEGLRLTVFDDVGALRATIESERGRLNQASSELIAIGDVLLTIPADETEIRSPELRFAPETDRIWTDSAVVMTEGDCTIEGTRLQADMSFDDVRIWGTEGNECTSR
ncbi:MAG: LPS export ABC transporter periplasmic protein LptC [Longimicrobiales bacterium]